MYSIKELEELIYNENINLDNAFKVVNNWEDIKKNLPERRRRKIEKQEKICDPLISLKKICKNKSSVLSTTYKFSKILKTHGRLYAQNVSLQSLPKEIRNALAIGKYHDIDIKNAHPCILAQYCEQNGIKCDIVDEYISNREAILTKICSETTLTRDDAKDAFLSMLNGGECHIENSFINEFRNEMRLIHKQICLLNQDEYKKIKTRKEFNPSGTMVSVILCKIEHTILMTAVHYLITLGYSVDVLIYDGFMVRIDVNRPINQDILNNISDYVKEKTSYYMTFVEKPIVDMIDLDKYNTSMSNTQGTYLQDKEEFEKTHLKIINPPMYLTLRDEGRIEYKTEQSLLASYKHLKTTVYDEENDKIVKQSFITKWINDENIRVYDNMCFQPPPVLRIRDKEFNTWTGFEQDKIPLPDNFEIETNIFIQRFVEFVNNLFNNNKEYVNYFLALVSNIIQRPSKRACICLILYSNDEGAGKDTVLKTIHRCIGENYINIITDAKHQLFGKHSAPELNKLLIDINELKGGDAYSNTDLFKTRITDDKREIELKGKDTQVINNLATYICKTNNEAMANVGESDRRFCVLDCNNPKMGDKLYFAGYDNEINNNPEAIRCIFEYLKKFDIQRVVPNYIFSDARPKSHIYLELQQCNRPKEWAFVEDLVLKNRTNYDTLEIPNESLWCRFKTYCQNNNYDITKLSSCRFHYHFSQKIITPLDKQNDYNGAIYKDRNKTSRYYTFDMVKLKKYFNVEEVEEVVFVNDD